MRGVNTLDISLDQNVIGSGLDWIGSPHLEVVWLALLSDLKKYSPSIMLTSVHVTKTVGGRTHLKHWFVAHQQTEEEEEDGMSSSHYDC